MNYINEINTFNIWLQGNPTTANAQALWYKLMSYCNSFCWIEYFTLTNTRLAEDLNISRQSLDRARNELCQKGRIEYKKGAGNQCGIYSIISFDVTTRTQSDTQCGHNLIHSADTVRTQSDTQCGSLNKLDKTKLNKKRDTNVSPKEKAFFENLDVNDAFIDFLELRKRLKAENTERAIVLLVNKLEKYPDSVKIAMIEKSIENSWKGIFELKPGDSQTVKQPQELLGTYI